MNFITPANHSNHEMGDELHIQAVFSDNEALASYKLFIGDVEGEHTHDFHFEEEKDIEITLFPNPASSGFINIVSPILARENIEISVLTITGIPILSQRIEILTSFYRLNVSDLRRGAYVLQIGNEKEKVSKKLVVW